MPQVPGLKGVSFEIIRAYPTPLSVKEKHGFLANFALALFIGENPKNRIEFQIINDLAVRFSPKRGKAFIVSSSRTVEDTPRGRRHTNVGASETISKNLDSEVEESSGGDGQTRQRIWTNVFFPHAQDDPEQVRRKNEFNEEVIAEVTRKIEVFQARAEGQETVTPMAKLPGAAAALANLRTLSEKKEAATN